MGVEAEAVLALEAGAEAVEDVRREFNDRSALVADQVVMGVVDEVVHGRPVAEMDVVDHSEVGQRVECAVDGRQVDLGMSAFDLLGERLGGDVMLGVEQRGNDRPARLGHPPASLSESFQDLLETSVGHRGEPTDHRGVVSWSRWAGTVTVTASPG